jgi:hypothetical protein
VKNKNGKNYQRISTADANKSVSDESLTVKAQTGHLE